MAKKLFVAYNIMISEQCAYINKEGNIILEIDGSLIADKETLSALAICTTNHSINNLENTETQFKGISSLKLSELIKHHEYKEKNRIKDLEKVEKKYNMLISAFNDVTENK